MPGYRIAHCFSLSSTLFNYIFTALKTVTCLDEKVSIYSDTFCIGVECRLVTFGVVVAMVTGEARVAWIDYWWQLLEAVDY